jgi:hypothetical protein
LQTCGRCRTIVEQVRAEAGDRSRAVYTALGPHLRHCLEHFQCFLHGLETGTIDYDARARDIHVETDPDRFLDALSLVEERLGRLTSADMHSVVTVKTVGADGADPSEVPSSIQRELLFLSSHTIHHLAVIDLTARQHGIELASSLALAFSTAAHLRSVAAQEHAR